MNKKVKIISKILIIVMIPVFAIGIYYANNYLTQTNSHYHTTKIKTEHSYKVIGAVEKEYQIKTKETLTYRQLFFKVNLKSNADLRTFKLNDLAPINTEIFIPTLLENKISWFNILGKKQLISLGLDDRTADNIWKLKEKLSYTPTWNDIVDSDIFDYKDIQKLKSILILD
ncbi:MAG0490 family ComEA-like DNA-binding protein [Mycoplasma buteonis]|uniref:MAG0490 family ComEA-like DNA-binding protein n=1 Tax=Mycoplasma buteonis TaxID=171280 RepID=UPI000564A1CE|nr:hypothetical protein [Mycoplasma buteonis]